MMEVKDNPFSELGEMLKKEETKADIRIGQVVSGSPLVIQLGDLPIDSGNKLFVADHLTNLRASDRVVVVQSNDKQVYNVIARVRRA